MSPQPLLKPLLPRCLISNQLPAGLAADPDFTGAYIGVGASAFAQGTACGRCVRVQVRSCRALRSSRPPAARGCSLT